jgi:hypothetical protein
MVSKRTCLAHDGEEPQVFYVHLRGVVASTTFSDGDVGYLYCVAAVLATIHLQDSVSIHSPGICASPRTALDKAVEENMPILLLRIKNRPINP